MRQVDELIQTGLSSESAQCGYVLTGDPAYLSPYTSGRENSAGVLAKLIQRYQVRDESEVPVLEAVRASLDSKYDEMDGVIAAMRGGNRYEALRLLRTDVGLNAMAQVRQGLEMLRARENARIADGIALWNSQVRVIRFTNLASTLLTLVLLIAVGLLISHEIKRRNQATKELELEPPAATYCAANRLRASMSMMSPSQRPSSTKCWTRRR
jgi:CHASE3 domain sensor protein